MLLETFALFTQRFGFWGGFVYAGDLKPFGSSGHFIEGKNFETLWVGLGEGKERE